MGWLLIVILGGILCGLMVSCMIWYTVGSVKSVNEWFRHALKIHVEMLKAKYNITVWLEESDSMEGGLERVVWRYNSRNYTSLKKAMKKTNASKEDIRLIFPLFDGDYVAN